MHESEYEYIDLIEAFREKTRRTPTQSEIEQLVEIHTKEKNKAKPNVFLKALGFFLGFGMIFVIEISCVGFLENALNVHFSPRGLGWLILPIGGGIAGTALISLFAIHFQEYVKSLTKLRTVKALSIGTLFWIVVVIAFVWVFEPFAYMYDEDYYFVANIALFPPTVIIVGYLLYDKFIRR